MLARVLYSIFARDSIYGSNLLRKYIKLSVRGGTVNKSTVKKAKTTSEESLDERSIGAVQADKTLKYLRATESGNNGFDVLPWWM